MSDDEWHDLVYGESPLRVGFEKLMKQHYYRTERNADGEYTQAAVFHMWTGYCLASRQANQPVIEEQTQGVSG